MPWDLCVGESDVHVWAIDLDIATEDIGRLSTLLSKDEMSSALRFRFVRERNRYIAAHGILRETLSLYLGADPADIGFEFGTKGKPYLRCPWNTAGLSYNIAHSQGMGLFGITRNRPIGVDVEQYRELADLDEISTSFHENERLALLRKPPAERRSTFFNCWTRKEAYLKAIGEGLSHPLDQFEVSADCRAAGLARPISHGLGPDWSIWDVPAGPNAAAAIAAQGCNLQISCRVWDRKRFLSQMKI